MGIREQVEIEDNASFYGMISYLNEFNFLLAKYLVSHRLTFLTTPSETTPPRIEDSFKGITVTIRIFIFLDPCL